MEKADPRRTATYRAAMAAVIILSTLLVVALVAVVAGFVRQARLYQAGHAGPAAATSTTAVSVMLVPGAHIVSAATDSGRLVLHVRTAGGNEVDIFDIATGKLTAQIKDGAK